MLPSQTHPSHSSHFFSTFFPTQWKSLCEKNARHYIFHILIQQPFRIFPAECTPPQILYHRYIFSFSSQIISESNFWEENCSHLNLITIKVSWFKIRVRRVPGSFLSVDLLLSPLEKSVPASGESIISFIFLLIWKDFLPPSSSSLNSAQG